MSGHRQRKPGPGAASVQQPWSVSPSDECAGRRGGLFTDNPGDSDDEKAIPARPAAGSTRSIMLSHPGQPDGTTVADSYRTPVTDHWSRAVHANSPIGYAFPSDDVRPYGETSRAPRTTGTRGASR